MREESEEAMAEGPELEREEWEVLERDIVAGGEESPAYSAKEEDGEEDRWEEARQAA